MDIYLITNKQNNKKYVGQCKTIDSNGKYYGFKKRWYAHCSKNSKCTYLKNAIEKYGKQNFEIELITQCTAEQSDELEIFYIKTYNTLVPNGYNLETGGNKNKFLSEETKKKMSLSRIGHPSYTTNESKIKISKGLQNFYSENPINKFDHLGKILPKYISCVYKNREIIGYSINNHMTGFRKKLTSKKLTLDEKLKKMIELSNG
jgi:group I intron endonuclease